MNSNQNPETLSGRLRSIRIQRGLTVKCAAKMAGISQPYLTQIETGLRLGISLETASSLAAIYGVETVWILEGDPLLPAKQALERALEESGLKQLHERALGEIDAHLSRFPLVSEIERGESCERISAIVAEFTQACDRGADVVVAARKALEAATAKLRVNRWIESDKGLERKSAVLDKLANLVDVSDMGDLWQSLLEQTKAILPERGGAALARQLGVSRQAVHEYLTETSVPGAEVTLRLLEWVKANGANKKSPEGVEAPSEPMTQSKKSNDEKPRPGQQSK